MIKGFNKKPIMNAAVVFHPVKDGRDEGNMEMKTDPDGKAVIDVIPTGSKVTIQVIADGFATFAQDYQINEASRQIVISHAPPAGAGLRLHRQQRQAGGVASPACRSRSGPHRRRSRPRRPPPPRPLPLRPAHSSTLQHHRRSRTSATTPKP